MSSGTGTNPAAPARYQLRGDVRVSAAEDGGFVLEDPRAGKLFRLGPAEYAALAQLDGQTDLREAVIRAASCRDGQQPTAERFAKLQTWLAASGLMETNLQTSMSANPSGPAATSTLAFNPCYFRYSFGNPARLLTIFERTLGWLFSLPALALLILVSLGAGIFACQRWQALTTSLDGILCPDQHLALFVCWLLLKTAHEIGHGAACHRLGGEVREWGLAFIYLMPVPYTDVTSSWRFSSRYDRIAVAAAGMYVEWILALIALLVWAWSPSAAVQQLCVYTISLATLTTILFNANPLCRLDGYYILSDLLGWPNFALQAQRVAGNWFRQLIGGGGDARTTANEYGLSSRRYWLLLTYGIASAAWRQLALATMAVVVLIAYEGLGALLIAGVLIAWYAQLRSPAASSLTDRAAGIFRSPRRLVLTGAIVSVIALLGCVVPWPFPIRAPGIVEHAAQQVVRTRVAGHVVALHAADGQWVEAGQTLVVLQNDEVAFELAHLERALAHSEAQLRSLHSKRQMVDYQVQQQRHETLQLQLAEQRRQVDSLTIKAPMTGRVLARRFADVPGSYLTEGAELCTIVGDGLKFRFSIAERELPYFVAEQGKPIQVRLSDRAVDGVLNELEPQASTQLFDPALSAAHGGPLPVVAAAASSEQSSETKDGVLIHPRVTGDIFFPSQEWPALRAGQHGTVALHSPGRSFATVFAAWGRRWLAGLQQSASD